MPPGKEAARDKLAMYTMPLCPFCWRVTRVINRLGLDVEMCDVLMHPAHREELIQATGRATVPVLCIQSADGEVSWMPESRDIIRYLQQTYA
ncbi:MAG: glutaredoxin [Xanthomonadales bacterium]|jgi:glutaredoxin|nr:glutaredoxin [Xanthomonadales bacterium]